MKSASYFVVLRYAGSTSGVVRGNISRASAVETFYWSTERCDMGCYQTSHNLGNPSFLQTYTLDVGLWLVELTTTVDILIVCFVAEICYLLLICLCCTGFSPSGSR